MKAKIVFIIFNLALILSSCAAPQPEPTAAPTSVPPTETPMPTATFTLEPTATSTPVPDGPCDNPLVPLVTGNQWEYLVSGGQNSFPYKMTVGARADIGNINIYVDMLDQKRDRLISELVVCQGGAIDNFPLYVMSMLLSGYLDGILNTYKNTGTYVPAYQDFAQNNWMHAWQSQYLIEEPVGLASPLDSATLSIEGNSPVDVSFQTEGLYEPVAVPAGTFPRALVVVNDYTLQVTLNFGSVNTSGELVIHTRQWYVPYIGLIRAQVDSTSLDLTGTQGAGMPIDNVLELTTFTQGK